MVRLSPARAQRKVSAEATVLVVINRPANMATSVFFMDKVFPKSVD